MTYSSFIWQIVRPHRRRFVLALAAMVLVMLVGLIPPLILAFVVDTVLGQGRFDLLGPVMVLALLLPFLDGLFRAGSEYMVALLGERVVLDIRVAL